MCTYVKEKVERVFWLFSYISLPDGGVIVHFFLNKRCGLPQTTIILFVTLRCLYGNYKTRTSDIAVTLTSDLILNLLCV